MEKMKLRENNSSKVTQVVMVAALCITKQCNFWVSALKCNCKCTFPKWTFELYLFTYFFFVRNFVSSYIHLPERRRVRNYTPCVGHAIVPSFPFLLWRFWACTYMFLVCFTRCWIWDLKSIPHSSHVESNHLNFHATVWVSSSFF